MANESDKKYPRGEFVAWFEGTVGTDPKTNKVTTKNGELDICTFRVVASPYRPGQKELQDEWVTAKVVGRVDFAEKLNKGDLVAFRGGVSTRSYKRNDGVMAFDITVNIDGPNCLRRVLPGKKTRELMEGGGGSTEQKSAAVGSTDDGSNLFN